MSHQRNLQYLSVWASWSCHAGWSGVIISIGAIIAIAYGSTSLHVLGALDFYTFWLAMSCFFYKTWFDMFFRRKSAVTPGVLEPEDGNTTTQLSFQVIQTLLLVLETQRKHSYTYRLPAGNGILLLRTAR